MEIPALQSVLVLSRCYRRGSSTLALLYSLLASCIRARVGVVGLIGEDTDEDDNVTYYRVLDGQAEYRIVNFTARLSRFE